MSVGAFEEDGSARTARREQWTPLLAAVLAVGLAGAAVLRVLLLPSEGLERDLDQFAGWTHLLVVDGGLTRIYDQGFAFGPVMAYALWFVGHLAPAFQIADDASSGLVRAVLKMPAVAADMAIAIAVVYALGARPRVAVASALAIAYVPVTWFLSAYWGQYESVYTLFGLLAAIAAARGHWSLAGVMLGLALGTKPQALPFIVPLAAFAVARLGIRRAAVPAAATALTLLALWLPFVADGGPTAYVRWTTTYQGDVFAVLSLRAWNPWWILQSLAAGDRFLADGAAIAGPLSPRLLGYMATVVGLALVFVALRRRATERALYLALAGAVLVTFCLLTTMHERYSYAAVVFLVLLVADRRILPAWLVLSAALTANYIAIAPPGGIAGSLVPFGGPIGIVGSVAITGVAVYVMAVLLIEPGSAGPDHDVTPIGGLGAVPRPPSSSAPSGRDRAVSGA